MGHARSGKEGKIYFKSCVLQATKAIGLCKTVGFLLLTWIYVNPCMDRASIISRGVKFDSALWRHVTLSGQIELIHTLQSGARHTKEISIKFQIRLKYIFHTFSKEHFHIPRQ